MSAVDQIAMHERGPIAGSISSGTLSDSVVFVRRHLLRPQDQRAISDPPATHPAGASSTASDARAGRNAPSRHAMNSATATTATISVEIALIWGETPNLIAL